MAVMASPGTQTALVASTCSRASVCTICRRPASPPRSSGISGSQHVSGGVVSCSSARSSSRLSRGSCSPAGASVRTSPSTSPSARVSTTSKRREFLRLVLLRLVVHVLQMWEFLRVVAVLRQKWLGVLLIEISHSAGGKGPVVRTPFCPVAPGSLLGHRVGE